MTEISGLSGVGGPPGFMMIHERFKERGYDIDVTSVGGVVPTFDASSLDPNGATWVRPKSTRIDDTAKCNEWKSVIDAAPESKTPLAVETITRDQVATYDGIFRAGGMGVPRESLGVRIG